MTKIYPFLSFTAAASWVLAGVVIAGSIYYNPQSYPVNLTLGLVMILIGVFLYLRAGSLNKLRRGIAETTGVNQEQDLSLLMHNYIIWDLLLVFLSLFVGGILAFLALYRVFSENLAVFG